VGDCVLVRVPRAKKVVRGKRSSLIGSCEGRILESDHQTHNYFIEFKEPFTEKTKKRWFKVDDVTSLTREEENERQRSVRKNKDVPTPENVDADSNSG